MAESALTSVAIAVAGKKERPVRDVANLADLQYPTACCCERCSFFLKWPELLGGAAKTICLCVETTGSCGCYIDETPRICCKVEETCLCCDVRAALPCDGDVPFAIGCCGVMLYEPVEINLYFKARAAGLA